MSHLLCRLELTVQTTPERWLLQLLWLNRNISEFCIWLHGHMLSWALTGTANGIGDKVLISLFNLVCSRLFLISFSFWVFTTGVSMVDWGITGVLIASERVSGKNLSDTYGIVKRNLIIFIKSDEVPQSTSLSKTVAIKTTRLHHHWRGSPTPPCLYQHVQLQPRGRRLRLSPRNTQTNSPPSLVTHPRQPEPSDFFAKEACPSSGLGPRSSNHHHSEESLYQVAS